MLIDLDPKTKDRLKKFLQRQYAGGVVDAVTGMKSGTRLTSRKRGVFATKTGDYCFLDLLLARTRVVLGKHGTTPVDPGHPLPWRILFDMVDRLEAGTVAPEPSYLVMGPAPDPEDAGPMARRMLDGMRGDRPGIFLFAEGSAAMAIVTGLSAKEVHQHLDALGDSGAESVFVVDTAKVLRGILAKLRQLGQPVPGEEPKP